MPSLYSNKTRMSMLFETILEFLLTFSKFNYIIATKDGENLLSIAKNIKNLREKHGLTQQQMGVIAGVSDKAVSTWENGANVPRMGAIQKIADYFGIPKSDIVDDQIQPRPLPINALPVPETRKIPIRGDIACGKPMLAIEEVDEYADVPVGIPGDFVLRCHGDSMIGSQIIDGDLAHIKSQDDVQNGQIAAVEVDGEFDREATLKRIRKIYNRSDVLVAIELHAENPAFEVMRYDGEEMNSVHIRGLLVGVTRVVRQ